MKKTKLKINDTVKIREQSIETLIENGVFSDESQILNQIFLIRNIENNNTGYEQIYVQNIKTIKLLEFTDCLILYPGEIELFKLRDWDE